MMNSFPPGVTRGAEYLLATLPSICGPNDPKLSVWFRPSYCKDTAHDSRFS